MQVHAGFIRNHLELQLHAANGNFVIFIISYEYS